MAANFVTETAPEPMTAYAINEDSNTVNRIHADDVAMEHGFDGALVSGAHVFGHLSEFLTMAYGESWLSDSELAIRFLRPAYDGDLLHIGFAPEMRTKEAQFVVCRNDKDQLLSSAEFKFLSALPTPSPLSRTLPPTGRMVRREIRWSAVRPGEAFPESAWTPSREENITSASAHSADLSLWETGLVHPRLWLDLANRALTNRFIMPAWLHLETRIIARRKLRTGTDYRLLATPEVKWRHRRNEYMRLYLAVLDGDLPLMEIWHTANFLIRRSNSPDA